MSLNLIEAKSSVSADSSICSFRASLTGSPSRSSCIQPGSAAASVDCSTSASSLSSAPPAQRRRGRFVDSTQSEGIAFVTKKGLVEKRRILESTLDLRSFDPAKFEPRAKELESKGIVFASLAEEMSREPTSGRKLYELENSADRDVPNIVEPTR